MNDDIDQVIVVPRSDPVFSVFTWRQDSIAMARLRPVLARLRDIPDEPCRLGLDPDMCPGCPPCQLRTIKIELFGEPRSNHE